MLENLKITSESKKGLEWLKETYSFTTYSVAIDTVVQFFKNNNVSPKDLISNSFSESLFNFKKELYLKLEDIAKKENDNTERIIKISRRIEEDSIKPIKKNVFDIHKVALDYYNAKSNKSLIENVLENSNVNSNDSINKDKIIEFEKLISEQDFNIKRSNSIIDEQDKKIKEYHRCLKIINEKVGFVDTLKGKKVYIDLPFDEVQSLFYLIP